MLLDALLIGPKTVSMSSVVANVPSGKAVVVLDSGTSYTCVFEHDNYCTTFFFWLNELTDTRRLMYAMRFTVASTVHRTTHPWANGSFPVMLRLI